MTTCSIQKPYPDTEVPSMRPAVQDLFQACSELALTLLRLIGHALRLNVSGCKRHNYAHMRWKSLLGSFDVYIPFSHAIVFCFDQALGCFAFSAHVSVSSLRTIPLWLRAHAICLLFSTSHLSQCTQPLELPVSQASQSSHISLISDFLCFLFKYRKDRWKLHQSSHCHIQLPTHHFWRCVGIFER